MGKEVSDVDGFLLLRKQFEQATQRRARAEGGLAQLLSRLRNEFGCESCEDAEKFVAKRQKQIKQDVADVEEKKRKMIREHKDKLENV